MKPRFAFQVDSPLTSLYALRPQDHCFHVAADLERTQRRAAEESHLEDNSKGTQLVFTNILTLEVKSVEMPLRLRFSAADLVDG